MRGMDNCRPDMSVENDALVRDNIDKKVTE